MTIIVAYVVSAAVFVRLPARVTTNWLIPEDTNEWIMRAFLAFFLPTAGLFVAVLFRRLSFRDPLRRNYEKFHRTYVSL